MAWTTPRTWVPGETVTASIMNAHVRDNLQALYDGFAASSGPGIDANWPEVFAYHNTTQTPTPSTWVQTSYNTEAYDSENAFASNTFTVPSGMAGDYFICSWTKLTSQSGGLFHRIQHGASTLVTEFHYPHDRQVAVALVDTLAVGETVYTWNWVTAAVSLAAGGVLSDGTGIYILRIG